MDDQAMQMNTPRHRPDSPFMPFIGDVCTAVDAGHACTSGTRVDRAFGVRAAPMERVPSVARLRSLPIRTYYKPDPAFHGRANNPEYFGAQ